MKHKELACFVHASFFFRNVSVCASSVDTFKAGAPVLLPEPGCHQDVLEYATVLLQTSLHVVGGSMAHEAGQAGHEILPVTPNRSNMDKNFMDAALRKGESFEQQVVRFQKQLKQAHTHSSSMSAGSTHRITITYRQRLQKLMYDILLWTPMWLLAGVISWYGRSSRAEKYGSTSALSGLRTCLALWVMLEHAGFTEVPASGAFIVLSGAALSTSRFAQPGVTKTPFNTLQSYFEFIFLRMARVLPLYWVWFGCLHPDPDCLKEGSTIGGCDLSKWSQGRSTFDDMVLFYLRMPRNLINAFQNQTCKMLLIGYAKSDLGSTWFLQTIMIMYIFYPILESLALGCCSKQPALPSQLRLAFFMWCIAKVVLVVPASLLRQGMGETGGWLVYTNPVLRVPDFMLGILLPHLANPDGKGWIQWAPLVADILIVSLGFVLIFAPLSGVALTLVKLNIEAPLTAFAIWGFCYGPSPSPLGRLLSMPLLVKIGEWSYGVYVMNCAVLNQYHLLNTVTDSLRFPDWTAEHCFLPFLIILVLGMSWSVFVLIETPCSNLARWAVAKDRQPTKIQK